MRLALDGVTSFSSTPLKLSFSLGLFATVVGLLMSGYALYSKVFYPDVTLSGWTSLLIVMVFLGGIQLISIGIMGEYIGRIYDEVKQRPLDILAEEVDQK